MILPNTPTSVGVKASGLRALPTLAAMLVTAAWLLAVFVAPPPALASTPAPAWSVTSARAPTDFVPGDHSGQDSYLVSVTNSGGAPSDGSSITITDNLPSGLTLHPTGASASEGFGFSCSAAAPIVCTGTGTVPPGGVVTVSIPVDVAPNAPEEVTNHVSVSGGGASFVADTEQTPISAHAAPFTFQDFDGTLTNADGSPDSQTGSHPYEMTTTIEYTTAPDAEGHTDPAGSPKDINVALPPGLIGDPAAASRCTGEALRVGLEEPAHGCPIGAQVGVITLRQDTFNGPNEDEGTFAVYNMEPPPGKPAELAFGVSGVLVPIDFGVRTGTDYGLTASLSDVSAALAVTGSTLTIWGVPADPSHDAQRCPRIDLSTGVCDGTSEPSREPHSAGVLPAPFLTLPSPCSGPLQTTITADSWQAPGMFQTDSFLTHDNFGAPIGLDGCNQLSLEPSISIQPDTAAADSPAGLNLELAVPQNQDPAGLAEATLRAATVRLPAGVSVNPSSADGLAACAPNEISLGDASKPRCPTASKIGSVEVDTPLLPKPLTGAVYLAQQAQNPFASLLAIYVTAEGNGVLVKLAGHVEADPSSGQLTTTFENTPQLPFSEFKLELFGGARAPLSTPPTCGSYESAALFTPWSGEAHVSASSSFAITSGAGGAPCADPLPFSPALSAGSTNLQAGAFTLFGTTISREDGNQNLSAVQLHMPEGLLGKLSSVTPCPEPQASEGTCGPESEIGQTTVSVGLGSDPYTVSGGKVFITGPYKGAPFGLSIAEPAKAGPFDLGSGPCDCVVVRSKIDIDPQTSALTVTSDALPTMLQGIPLQLKHVNVTVDRPGFTFNPTNCSQLAITATIAAEHGASVPVSVPFEVANCATLPFKPRFSVSTQAKTSKANGASLHVKLTQKPGEANIHKVDLQLPLALPSRLTTLQKACSEAQFATNPAGCPPGSVIGTATAHTPVLQTPLTGPAYLVSHGGAAFPDVVFLLQGDERGGNIRIDVVGNTDIKKGITYSRFETVPDTPISSFETSLPEGPHSALAAFGNLCAQSLLMPTTLVGQNGAQVKQSTKIAVTGCRAVTITGRRVTGRSVVLRFSLTSKGTVTVTGSGLKRYRKALGAGLHQIKVPLSSAGLSMRRHRRRIKIRVALKSGAKVSDATTNLKL